MIKIRVRLFVCFTFIVFINACSSDDQDISSIGQESAEEVFGAEENGEPGVPSGDSTAVVDTCLLYTSPSPRDKRQSRMPSSA